MMTRTSLDCQGLAAAPPAGQDNELRVRGLLHDLGHQMMTLSLLAESVRDDSGLSGDSRQRMDLVMQEMFRIVDIITDSAANSAGAAAPSLVDIRQLAAEVVQLISLASDTTVSVEPGSPAVIRICPTLMWRVLANLADNAVRATGPGGRVEIRVRQGLDTVLEVLDDGPGFGHGPAGMAGLGMAVVRQLLEVADGRLEIADRPGGGTCVRVIFGLAREYRMAPAGAVGSWH